MGWKRSVGESGRGLEVEAKELGFCAVASGMKLCQEVMETSEAQCGEAPALNVSGPPVEHMLNHNVSHRNDGFLEARGQFSLSGERWTMLWTRVD